MNRHNEYPEDPARRMPSILTEGFSLGGFYSGTNLAADNLFYIVRDPDTKSWMLRLRRPNCSTLLATAFSSRAGITKVACEASQLSPTPGI